MNILEKKVKQLIKRNIKERILKELGMMNAFKIPKNPTLPVKPTVPKKLPEYPQTIGNNKTPVTANKLFSDLNNRITKIEKTKDMLSKMPAFQNKKYNAENLKRELEKRKAELNKKYNDSLKNLPENPIEKQKKIQQIDKNLSYERKNVNMTLNKIENIKEKINKEKLSIPKMKENQYGKK